MIGASSVARRERKASALHQASTVACHPCQCWEVRFILVCQFQTRNLKLSCSFESEPASVLHFAKLNVEPRTSYLVDKFPTIELLPSPRVRPPSLDSVLSASH